MTKSVAFLKFRTLLESEIRTFWHVMAALEYSERWLASNSPSRLTLFPGDDKYPFKAIDILPSEFIAEQSEVMSHIRENALVSFVTSFECYLFELLERLIYLQPDLVADSEMQISVKQLACSVPDDMRRWLATKVADKYLRNKTHAEMLAKLDTICKAGVTKRLSSEIAEWTLWSLARNSIVHTSRQVTSDLSKSWPARFPSPGGRLRLENKELSRVHHLALKIAEAIDERAIASVIGKQDELLIARELFVQRGIDQSNVLKFTLGKLMKVKCNKPDLDRMVSEKRRGVNFDRWELSVRDLGLISVL